SVSRLPARGGMWVRAVFRRERSTPASINRSTQAAMMRVLLLAAVATTWSMAAIAQGRATAPPDISGYWELPLDGKHIPRARLTSRITPTILQAQAQKDAKAIRWCNW